MTSNNKNIVWLDIETTGLNPQKDRIIQIGMIKTDYDFNVIDAIEQKFNPQGVKSSEEALAKHKITDDELIYYPLFSEAADQILEFIKDCDLGGHNHIKFDIPFIMAEMTRCGRLFSIEKRRLIDTKLLYKHFNYKHLEDIYREYCPNDELECNAHDAICDTQMCMEVYKAMVQKHNPSKEEIDKVNGNLTRIDVAGFFVFNENMDVCMGKGKYYGMKFEDVDPLYFNWMICQDLPAETINLARRCLNFLQSH